VELLVEVFGSHDAEAKENTRGDALSQTVTSAAREKHLDVPHGRSVLGLLRAAQEQGMRGYAKDEERTRMAYFSGRFQDKKKRSYIDNLGHEHLRGKDRSDRRELLFRAVKGLCVDCGRYRDEDHGDMDHEGKTPKTRCDCLETPLNDGTRHTGIAWRCGMLEPGSCHRKRHNREPRWTPKRGTA